MKKFFISLGACLVAGAVGVGALLCIKENYNKSEAVSYDDDYHITLTADEVNSLEFPTLYQYLYDSVLDVHEIAITYKNYTYSFVNLDDSEAYNWQSEDLIIEENKIYNIRLNSSGRFSWLIDDNLYDIDSNFTLNIGNSEFTALVKEAIEKDTFGIGKTFTFANQINYYAPYDSNISSDFVSDSAMTSNNLYIFVNIYQGSFKSGGQTFDTIRARYVNAIGLLYLQQGSSSTYTAWTSDYYASFEQLEYYNSTTNHIEIVNKRNTKSVTYNNGVGLAQLQGSTWVSQSYRDITFISPINESILTNLDKLNNALLGSGSLSNSSDIGLDSAFTLLGQAFSSVAGLLAIQVLPNITLGLLLFLPLIIGIIITIIWVVKR